MKTSVFSLSGLRAAADTGRARFAHEGAPEGYSNRITAYEAGLREILDRFEPIVSAVRDDKSLSSQGITKAVTERLCRCWNAVEALAVKEYGDLEKIIQSTQVKIQVRPYLEGGDPVFKLLQAQEVRAVLRPRIGDTQGRRSVTLAYEKACQEGTDPLLVYAIESAPTAAPILDAKTIEAGRLARAKAENPQAVRDVELFMLLKEHLDYCTHQAKKTIQSAGLGKAAYDWGKLQFNDKGGLDYEVKFINLRPLQSKFVDPEGLYKTSPLKAEAHRAKDAGYESGAFLNGDYMA